MRGSDRCGQTRFDVPYGLRWRERGREPELAGVAIDDTDIAYEEGGTPQPAP